MADRITNDMLDMARSYEPTSGPLLQDDKDPKLTQRRGVAPGTSGSLRDFASMESANEERPKARDDEDKGENPESELSASVMDTRPMTTALGSAFEKEDEQDDFRHDALMRSQDEQTRALSDMSDTMSNVYRLLMNDIHGPSTEQYSGEDSGQEQVVQSVRDLATQLGEQHQDIKDELRDIRYAIMNIDGGMLGGMFDMFDGFGRGRRRGRGRGGRRGGRLGGGGYDTDTRSRGSDRSRTGGSGNRRGIGGRIRGAVGGVMERVRGARGSRGKIAALVAGGAAALWGASEVMGSTAERGTAARDTYHEEEAENIRRERMGLPPLEGQELIDFRSEITREFNQIPNPNTGYALNYTQSKAVRSGMYTPEEVVNVDNDTLTNQLQANDPNFVPRSERSLPQTEASGAGGLLGGSNLGISGTELAVGGALAGGGAMVMSRRPQTPPTTMRNIVDGITIDRPVTASAPAGRTPALALPAPAGSTPARRPSTMRNVANRAASVVPEPVRAGARTATNGARTVAQGARRAGGAALRGARGVPLVGAALTAYDAYDVINDDTMTTGEKAGALTDMGGGLAGASAGAAIGASVGSVVPLVGTAIGGLAGGALGYMAGSGLTKSAREWVGGWFDDDEDEAEVESAESIRATGPALAQSDLVGDTAPERTPESAGTVMGRPAMRPPKVDSVPGASPEDNVAQVASAATAAAGGSAVQRAVQEINAATEATRSIDASRAAATPAGESASQSVMQKLMGGTGTLGAMLTGSPVAAVFNSIRETMGDISGGPRNQGPSLIDSLPSPSARASGNVTKGWVIPSAKKDDVVADIQPAGSTADVQSEEPVGQTMREPNAFSAQTPGAPANRSAVTRVSRVGQQRTVQASAGASNVTMQATKETPAQRITHDSVQKVMMIDPTVKKKATKEKAASQPRTPSSTGTYENRSTRPTIDDTPVITSDFGLVLLNSGLI